MAENNSVQTGEQTPVSVVTTESLAALREIIPTNDEVDAKIAEALSTCANLVFATTEDVLAIFGKAPDKEPETDPETTGGEA
ncbi:MAG: hypothetical protein K2O18_16365 [Oscillospiraceae bacterium]|nr:hypothetical protein [Oscillospiraceae bacterium]